VVDLRLSALSRSSKGREGFVIARKLDDCGPPDAVSLHASEEGKRGTKNEGGFLSKGPVDAKSKAVYDVECRPGEPTD